MTQANRSETKIKPNLEPILEKNPNICVVYPADNNTAWDCVAV